MKKNYSILALSAMLWFGSGSELAAQALSGTVTINSAQATGGTNYQTFTAFAAAVNTAGISGPLYVDVAPNSGPYNEQPAFANIAGTSATNTITINGNGNLLTFNSSNSAAPYTMLLNNVDFMTVANLQMQGTNATYAMVCVLTGGSDYNNFSACSFSCTFNGTGFYQIPFSFNSSTGLTSAGGNAGNFNTISTSTLYGGYYSIWHYGLTAAPYTRNNSFLNCRITDFYYCCIYGYYSSNLTIKGCEFDRMTRTNFTTTYFWFGDYTRGLTFDSNTLHDFWAANPSYTGQLYGFYYVGYGNTRAEVNTFRNNIFRDMVMAGTQYLFYFCYNANNDFIHNTFSYDNQTAGNGSAYLFYYCYGSGSNYNTWRNNNFSITQTGAGTKQVFYFVNNTTGSIINYNNYWLTSANSAPGYWTGTLANNFAAWQQQGPDANGTNINPMYVNAAAGNLQPTNTSLNNTGAPLGVFFDHSGAIRHQTTPDVGALEFLTPVCAGSPTNSITGPNYSLCPGETANFNVNNLSSDLGITYQWQYSTISNVGPFTPISGSTSYSLSAPNQTAQGWYSAIITCTAAGGGSIAPVWQVNISGNTISQVPYDEGFEGIGLNNRKPNCSWSVPGMGNTANTYTSAQTGNRLPRNGTSYGVFNSNTTASNYMYTNGIMLNAGVTYSASVWYQTDLTGATNFSGLSLLVGPNQSTTGLNTIVSTNGPAVSPVYKLLSGTFTVASSGTYYVAVRSNAAAGTAQFMSIDDLKINIPCTVPANQPTLSATVPNATICTGNSAVITANGADTYTWAPNGANTAINNDQPQSTTTYTVSGTNTLTGCTNNTSIKITVKQSPVINAIAVPALVCEGKTSNLAASGASTYTWAVGGTGAVKTVTVTGAANYSVIGTGTNGCQASAVVAVNANPNPTVTANASQQVICEGETLTLTANGANTYQWVSTNPANVFMGNNLSYLGSMAGAYSYMVTGMDANGCEGSAQVNFTVDACLGITESGVNAGVSVFPNPTSGVLTVITSNGNNRAEVMDVTGRVVLTQDLNNNNQIDLSNFANGVYHLRVSGNNAVSMTKIVKQ